MKPAVFRLSLFRQKDISAHNYQQLTFPKLPIRKIVSGTGEIFSRVMKGEMPAYYNEKRYICKDGSTIWVRLNAAFIRDADGQAIRTVVICEDITGRSWPKNSSGHRWLKKKCW